MEIRFVTLETDLLNIAVSLLCLQSLYFFFILIEWILPEILENVLCDISEDI